MAPHDVIIDDDEDCWYVCLGSPDPTPALHQQANRNVSPLCVEEFDLSDKNFRPCPCGYQVSLQQQAKV